MVDNSVTFPTRCIFNPTLKYILGVSWNAIEFYWEQMMSLMLWQRMVSFPPLYLPLWTCHFWETSLNIVVRWGWGVGCFKALTCECQPTLQCNMYVLAEWVFMLCGHIPVISSKSLRCLVAFKEWDSQQMFLLTADQWRCLYRSGLLHTSRSFMCCSVACCIPVTGLGHTNLLFYMERDRQTDRYSDTPSASPPPLKFYLHWIFKFQEMQSL